MNDLISLYGYRDDSPFKSNPYLDIESPQGEITMKNTSIPLLGISDLGEMKYMKPGKNYKYRGKKIREIPIAQAGGVFTSQQQIDEANAMARRIGMKANVTSPDSLYAARSIGDPIPQFVGNGLRQTRNLPTTVPNYIQLSDIQSNNGQFFYNDPQTGYAVEVAPGVVNLPQFRKPMQRGGYNKFRDVYDFLYEDDQNEEKSPQQENPATAPSTDDLPEDQQQGDVQSEDDQLSMAIAFGDFSSRNPYVESNRQRGVNPYVTKTENDIFSTFGGVTNLGIWGDKAHQQRQSDHNTGDAQDFGVSDPNMGNQIATKLQNEASQRNIKYIIYNGKIWNPSDKQWRKYNGPDPHTSHIHVSYNR